MKKTLLIISGALLLASCDPGTGIITPVLPHNPVDEGWKAVENYEYSFNTKDLTLLEETLDPSFLYELPESEWDDYNGDGIIDTFLTKELYLQTISALFSSYEVVELNLNGDSEFTWAGDSTGSTLILFRDYDKTAYNWVGGQQEGFTELGSIVFLTKPDTTGSWKITSITEQPEQ